MILYYYFTSIPVCNVYDEGPVCNNASMIYYVFMYVMYDCFSGTWPICFFILEIISFKVFNNV